MMKKFLIAACVVGASVGFAYGDSGQPVVPVVNGAAVSTANPMPVDGTVLAQPNASTTTNDSGTITTGGTFQQIAAASTSRLSLDVQNLNASDSCYIYFGTTAAANSAGVNSAIKVAASQEYLRSSGAIPSDAIQITCSTNSDKFYAAVQ